MTITLLHILKALFRNSTFPRLHRKTHVFALSDCPLPISNDAKKGLIAFFSDMEGEPSPKHTPHRY